VQSEETKSSDRNGSYGIITAVIGTMVIGYAYVVGVTFAVTDVDHILDITNDAHGYAIAQIFYDAFQNRYGSGTGGIVCLVVVSVAVFFCGLTSVTSNSRCATFSKFWSKNDVLTSLEWPK
jgi:amino acid transporter